jgi:hypothetical protein
MFNVKLAILVPVPLVGALVAELTKVISLGAPAAGAPANLAALGEITVVAAYPLNPNPSIAVVSIFIIGRLRS